MLRGLNVTCTYVNVTREAFLAKLVEKMSRSHQPLTGPNSVGGELLRDAAVRSGVSTLVSGELCDTVFGGLSGFYHMSPRFRMLRRLSRLPYKIRNWLMRATFEMPAWLLDNMRVGHPNIDARNGGGDLDSAEVIRESMTFCYSGQSNAQKMADVVTWMHLTTVPSALHATFFEYEEQVGPDHFYPFADPAMIRLGIHLPHYLKRRAGHNKWLWRKIVAPYIGRNVAFRRKYAFPTPTDEWINRATPLLSRGFLEHLLCVDVAGLYANMPPGDPSRWTLVNCELWGRIHCENESPNAILTALL
jgi:hypothetical protein